MRRCTGPVSCLPSGVVERPNGLYRGGEAYLSNAPSHPAGNASFILSFLFHTVMFHGKKLVGPHWDFYRHGPHIEEEPLTGSLLPAVLSSYIDIQ